jgi:hypothetical protein
MNPLFVVSCSLSLAVALGARPMPRLTHYKTSFPVFDVPRTHHAELSTENGPYAWLWMLDATHGTIKAPPHWRS